MPSESVEDVLAWLDANALESVREGMLRFAIPNDHAVGVSMKPLQKYAKALGRDHAFAEKLWQTGVYEARILAVYVDDPAEVTPKQMDRWCKDFDNWAICDTACFHLFDRTEHAWIKIEQWSKKTKEFEKRAAYALLASVALHDKKAKDDEFALGLSLIERESEDDRNFVKKATNWALRAIGMRNIHLHADAVKLAERLSASKNATARWVGKDAFKQLTKALVLKRFAKSYR